MDLYFHRRNLLALALLLTTHIIGASELYRWVDENGGVHYSDRVPPSQAQQPRTELNNYGRATREVNVLKTKEQILQEQQQLIEQLRQKRLREKEVAADRALLTTFNSTEDIDALYANRLQDLDTYTESNRRRLEKTRDLLAKTEKKRIWYQAREYAVPKQISDNIKEYKQQIATYELLIERNLAKRKKLEKKYKHDKHRYRFLTSESESE